MKSIVFALIFVGISSITMATVTMETVAKDQNTQDDGNFAYVNCTISTNPNNQFVTLLAPIISLLLGSLGGSLLTHRMMNSVCIKNARVSGEHNSITIQTNDIIQPIQEELNNKNSLISRIISKLPCGRGVQNRTRIV